MRMLPLLALLLTATGAQAADDLMTVYQQAQRHDPVINQAKAALNAAEELRPQARAALLPTIGATGGYERVRQDFDGSTSSSDDSFPSRSWSIQLTQPLFRYSSFILLKQADAQIAQSGAEFAAAEQNLITRAGEAYFGVLAALNALQVAQAEQAAVARQLEQAERRFEVGLIAMTEVHEARARRDLVAAQVIEAESLLASQLGVLEELTGRASWNLAPLRAEIPLTPPEPADPQAWQRTAEEQNWRLTAQRYAAEVALHTVGVRRGDHFPSLDLRGDYGAVNQDGGRFAGETRETSVGLNLTVPLYQGGAVNARIREAQHRYTFAREQLEETRRAVLRQTGDAYRGVLSSILRVRALEQAVVSTQSALEATEAGFEVGTRTIVDVLDAQRERFRAERDLQQARYDYLLNTLRLKQAAGTLAPEDLAAVNRLLKSG